MASSSDTLQKKGTFFRIFFFGLSLPFQGIFKITFTMCQQCQSLLKPAAVINFSSRFSRFLFVGKHFLQSPVYEIGSGASITDFPASKLSHEKPGTPSYTDFPRAGAGFSETSVLPWMSFPSRSFPGYELCLPTCCLGSWNPFSSSPSIVTASSPFFGWCTHSQACSSSGRMARNCSSTSNSRICFLVYTSGLSH